MSDDSLRNVEVQRADRDDHFKRIRYHGACITASYTPKGTDFKDVPDVYVVYITEFDLAKAGKTLSHLDSVIRESKTNVDDGFYRLLITAAVNDHSKIARLMQNFLKTDFDDPEFPESSRQIQRFKHTQKGAQKMSNVVQKYAEEYAQKYAASKMISAADNLSNTRGISVEEACNDIGWSYNEYQDAVKLLAEAEKGTAD